MDIEISPAGTEFLPSYIQSIYSLKLTLRKQQIRNLDSFQCLFFENYFELHELQNSDHVQTGTPEACPQCASAKCRAPVIESSRQ